MTEHTLKQKLLSQAEAVAENSYSPYSKFPVGAAVLTADNCIYTGTNVENSSYGLTICAERAAVVNAVSDGKTEIVAIAVVTKDKNAPPCGACLQFLLEFGSDIEVLFFDKGQLQHKKVSELLTNGFKPSFLD